jgi:mannose-6-phosphate isomerase
MLLEPRVDPKIWGGRRLETVLGKSLPANVSVGESLESDDASRIENGRLRGSTIRELIDRDPEELLGRRGIAASQPFGDFPLLAKFIDATDVLSVQVHPDDELAVPLSKRGKTEAWHIVHAEPGSKLITGVRQGVSVSQIERAIRDVRLGELLVEEQVKSGDTFIVPAGTTHAIGAGILLYEIQQASDVTFRMYDWGRLDDAGNPRDLHVKQSLEVLKPECRARGVTSLELAAGRRVLTACRYFALEQWDTTGVTHAPTFDGETFLLASCIRGALELHSGDSHVRASVGQTVLIPASLRELSLSGDATLLVSYIPDLENDIRRPLLDQGHSSEDIARLAGDLTDLHERDHPNQAS